jgi:hypothetical protein
LEIELDLEPDVDYKDLAVPDHRLFDLHKKWMRVEGNVM